MPPLATYLEEYKQARCVKSRIKGYRKVLAVNTSRNGIDKKIPRKMNKTVAIIVINHQKSEGGLGDVRKII